VPIARAPGRVTIIGDHTDYNAGLSLTMAIDLATEVRFTAKPGSFLVGVESDQFPDEPFEVALAEPNQPKTRATGAPPAGAALPPNALLAASLLHLWPPPGRAGGRFEVASTVPVGAGLSSSAAFSVAWLLVLGHDPDPLALARTEQEAERATGAHVGLLDPLAIAGATAQHALSIDFHALTTHPVAVPEEAAFVIVHSEAPRLLVESPYAARRAECERAAQQLGRPLGLCSLSDLSGLSDAVLRRRARHVVTECARVIEAERLLERGNLDALGQVMTEGQRSLAADYLVSVPAVDELVEHLLAQPGVLGARMSGGGFGGCVVALCEPGALDLTGLGRPAWRVRASAGARVRTS
jgi:galactokinase